MSKRRLQFNISALKFEDDVHDYILKLSESKRLAAWIAKHAEAEIRRNGTSTGGSACGDQVVLEELREIKQLLLGCSVRKNESAAEGKQPVIQQISSESMLSQSIAEDDLDYGF
ncbi:hypothetical protein [Paenibacillus sp. HB172176]|uniref:hypothetical protein n=1 Tax=Paenibacillus sp. HB172176 TaxID=2493690 RepID=UPI00143B3E22|nr:hypothetical protein [Paenibacillus sp. HB172176]